MACPSSAMGRQDCGAGMDDCDFPLPEIAFALSYCYLVSIPRGEGTSHDTLSTEDDTRQSRGFFRDVGD